MKFVKTTLVPVLLAGIWISISEFVRNQIIFPDYWVEHYFSLGLEFPAKPINGAVWGVWSMLFSVVLFFISRRFSWIETGLIGWLFGFAMMWLVIGNLGVLPLSLLKFAVPLSVLEAFLASYILHLFKQESPVSGN